MLTFGIGHPVLRCGEPETELGAVDSAHAEFAGGVGEPQGA